MSEESVAESDLKGLRILVVEDESLVTMLIEDTLADIGCNVVGKASELDEAISKASSLALDAAILDVNLDGSYTYSVAEALRQRGIPFVFSTGYGAAGLPETFRDVPILGKPFQQNELEQALTAAVAAKR